MSDQLIKHIKTYVDISDAEAETILKYFTPVYFKKKENLLSEGKICKANYFVVEGLLRLFFVNERGVEQTIQFALENWWMADYASLNTQQPATFSIQAIENTTVLAIGYKEQEGMLAKVPKMEKYFRVIYQRVSAATQYKIWTWYSMSGEEMYYNFINKHPDFVQRIPQYLLASFLGLTPEYLSEIRKKKKS